MIKFLSKPHLKKAFNKTLLNLLKNQAFFAEYRLTELKLNQFRFKFSSSIFKLNSYISK